MSSDLKRGMAAANKGVKYPALCLQNIPKDLTPEDLFKTISQITKVLRVRASPKTAFFFADFLNLEQMEAGFNILSKQKWSIKVYRAKNNDHSFTPPGNKPHNDNRSMKDNTYLNTSKISGNDEQIATNMDKCANCNLPADQRCGRCRDTFYCHERCQLIDWPLHRNTCCEVVRPENIKMVRNASNPNNNSSIKSTKQHQSANKENQCNGHNNSSIKSTNQHQSENKENQCNADNGVDLRSIMKTEKLPVPQTLPNNDDIVLVTAVISPSALFVRLLNDESERTLKIVQDEIKFAKAVDKIPAVGELILAKSQTIGYNRAVVINEEDNRLKVFFLDFGIYEKVLFTNVSEISFLCKYLPTFCGLMILDNLPQKIVLQNKLKSYYDSLIGREFKLLSHQICLESNQKIIKGRLFDIKLNDCMENIVKSLDMPLSKSFISDLTVKVVDDDINIPFVVVGNSMLKTVGTVVIVKQNDYSKLESLAQKVANAANLLYSEPYSPGLDELCLVKVGPQKWYRGKCEKILNSAKRKIAIIDFGFKVDVDISNIRRFPLDLKDDIITYECDVAGLPNDINADLGTRLMDLLAINKQIIVKRFIKHDELNLGYIVVPTLLNTLMAEQLIF